MPATYRGNAIFSAPNQYRVQATKGINVKIDISQIFCEDISYE